MLDVLRYFPVNISKLIENRLSKEDKLTEIRRRINSPIILKTENEIVVDYTINQNEILNIMQSICDNSIYSYQNEIINGYITVRRGTQDWYYR